LNLGKMQNTPALSRFMTLQALNFTHSIPRRPKIYCGARPRRRGMTIRREVVQS
jgi:hypothetical protein